MTKEGVLVTIGVLTAISPFSGIPGSILAYILPVLGLSAAIVAVLLLRARRAPAPVFHEASSTAA